MEKDLIGERRTRMRYEGLTDKELSLFEELLKKANNSQIEGLVTKAVNEHKDRMMRGF